ncbi:helix-turn-helix domain-containing protein [Anaeropeptidivorans aminofermentans]|uniref:helix-turn-helix domain-containing protein n=1 Tax=Anaeropeptidivorans aminofermentans TaxID=2934315 RepID=UPI000ECF3403|nr:helix-turn-helix domain-containing protein [Anaeropeptidivorans aminofermentans]HAQ41299.1 hypothetical protein [Clostridiales bacterium]
MQNKADVILNPIRLRIIQYVAHNMPVTVAQIARAISDISKATLYRHVRILVDNEILIVIGQKKIRGTLEQSYSLNLQKINSAGQESTAETQALVYSILGKLIEDFGQYFSTDTANPVEDRLFVGTNTLYLNNGSFDDFVQDIYAVVEKYSQLPADKNGKARMVTFVSSPASAENDMARE